MTLQKMALEKCLRLGGEAQLLKKKTMVMKI